MFQPQDLEKIFWFLLFCIIGLYLLRTLDKYLETRWGTTCQTCRYWGAKGAPPQHKGIGTCMKINRIENPGKPVDSTDPTDFYTESHLLTGPKFRCNKGDKI